MTTFSFIGNDSFEIPNLSSIGVQKSVDLGLELLVKVRPVDATDPSRGRDRVDQFLMPILWRLGEDEFRRLILFHIFGLFSSGRGSGSVGESSIEDSMNQHWDDIVG